MIFSFQKHTEILEYCTHIQKLARKVFTDCVHSIRWNYANAYFRSLIISTASFNCASMSVAAVAAAVAVAVSSLSCGGRSTKKLVSSILMASEMSAK